MGLIAELMCEMKGHQWIRRQCDRWPYPWKLWCKRCKCWA